jgi:tRNA-splicing ligase RtcB
VTEIQKIDGDDLISWGYHPGPWFGPALERANRLLSNGCTYDMIRQALNSFVPPAVEYMRRHEAGTTPYFINLDPETPDEQSNAVSVVTHMRELMRVPTIKAGAVMPDACPSGSVPGTIPVGGVVACENAIHPGYHSADICCSMAISVLPKDVNPKAVLDAAMQVTHFGPGGRERFPLHPSPYLLHAFEQNAFLKNSKIMAAAQEHFGTQGDGNHFFYVGRLKSTDQVCIVTHHGSRAPGAMLYKAGKIAAEKNTDKIAAGIPKHQAWLTADSKEGADYWAALQIIRLWTKQNHFVIHDEVASYVSETVEDRFWNEHNFVWQKPDGLFYHGKGATPAFPGFSRDTNGLTLIPLNMAEPILVTRGRNAPRGLGFAPHGAGRNMSRTDFKKTLAHIPSAYHAHQAAGLPDELDARWYSGTPDVSEMPGGYKNAAAVREQIETFGLADVVDEVLPYGCIMAGEIDWRLWGKKLGDKA